jgi:replicative DNA helicase
MTLYYETRDNEEALIGAVLRGGTETYRSAREIVQQQHFGNVSFGYIWLGFEKLFEQGMGIDQVTVGDEIERMVKMGELDENAVSRGMFSGRVLLSKLREEGEPANATSYAENVQDQSVKRALDPFFEKCSYWNKNGRRAKDIIKDINEEFSKIILYSAQDEYTVPISVAVSEAYDETDLASRGGIIGVPTGFIDLDKILGSLYKQNLYLIAARPGQGKTAFLLTIALKAALMKKRVAIFSLEMSRSQVAQRLIAQVANVDLSKIIKGKLSDVEWPLYTHAVEVVADLPIIINDLSSIDINSIRQTCRKIAADGGLDLVIFDYIQLAESGQKKSERRELDVSAISRGMKYLARELDIPVLAASQLSRELEKRSEKRPVLSDLRESGSLEQDAYAVMFIYRPDQYEKDSTKSGVAEIIIAKHRNGPVGSVDLLFQLPYAKFENAATRIFRPNLGYPMESEED